MKKIKKFIVGLIVFVIANLVFVSAYAEAPFEMKYLIKPNIQMYSNNIIGSGKCGENLTWSFYNDGMLEISGTGKMNIYPLYFAPWYQYTTSIKNLNIKEGVTSISDYAFYQCSGLTGDLVIPNSVTEIGRYAFSFCSGLTGDLIIPDSVTSIGDYAFYNCKGLTGNLVIPDSVKSIGSGAFSECSG